MRPGTSRIEDWREVLRDLEEGAVKNDPGGNFVEAPAPLLKESIWKVGCGCWVRREPINVLEARAAVFALERARRGREQRRRFLVDNLCVARRAKSHALLHLVRRWSTCCLARNVKPA